MRQSGIAEGCFRSRIANDPQNRKDKQTIDLHKAAFLPWFVEVKGRIGEGWLGAELLLGLLHFDGIVNLAEHLVLVKEPTYWPPNHKIRAQH